MPIENIKNSHIKFDIFIKNSLLTKKNIYLEDYALFKVFIIIYTKNKTNFHFKF